MYQFIRALHHQPVTVAFFVSNNFFNYQSGILDSDDIAICPNTTSINHAVLATGYRINHLGTSYIVFKNSWGNNWGENGYFKFKLKNNANYEGPCNLIKYSRFTLYPAI